MSPSVHIEAECWVIKPFLGWLGSILLPRNWGLVLVLTLPKSCPYSLPLAFTHLGDPAAGLRCWTQKFRRNLTEQILVFLL